MPVIGTTIGGIVGSVAGGILGADGMEALSQKLLGLNLDNRIDNTAKPLNCKLETENNRRNFSDSRKQGSNHAIRRDSALAMVDPASKTKAVDIEKVKAALHALTQVATPRTTRKSFQVNSTTKSPKIRMFQTKPRKPLTPGCTRRSSRQRQIARQSPLM